MPGPAIYIYAPPFFIRVPRHASVLAAALHHLPWPPAVAARGGRRAHLHAVLGLAGQPAGWGEGGEAPRHLLVQHARVRAVPQEDLAEGAVSAAVRRR